MWESFLLGAYPTCSLFLKVGCQNNTLSVSPGLSNLSPKISHHNCLVGSQMINRSSFISRYSTKMRFAPFILLIFLVVAIEGSTINHRIVAPVIAASEPRKISIGINFFLRYSRQSLNFSGRLHSP